MNKTAFGKQGEAMAVELLKAQGYRIIGQNVRSKFGEIDIVAQDGETLCFVEIRSRTGTKFGLPEESINGLKQWRLTRLANWYLQSRRISGVVVRFDVLSIIYAADGAAPQTRLIKGAFEASGG